MGGVRVKIACIQMNMTFCDPDANYAKAAELIERAAEQSLDVIVLPETWNTGFFPRSDLEKLCDRDGERTKSLIGGLAGRLGINIVAGSVANARNDGIYNTSYIFDRGGNCVAEYDKTHLFSPMGEHEFFRKGKNICRFMLDGHRCGVIICYDVRFPELTRSMAVEGLDLLFVVSQWPTVRIEHLQALTKARAIENQTFVVCCNSCGEADGTVYGGHSSVTDPWGKVITSADGDERIIFADCDTSVLESIRSRINVFADRRADLYGE